MNAPQPQRRISGHHFGDLLICPQRAWLAYHGDYALRLRDPAPLRSLQQAGIEHEADIYDRLYPDTLRIPENLPAPERAARTLEAMRSGEPVILQGYVSTDDGIGILDVLQLAGADPTSSTGFLYEVGEIKRSASLRTAHVFQACWYTELLEGTTGQHSERAFFILADGQPQPVDLRTVAGEYRAARAQLVRLRAEAQAPGAHFGPACLTCTWRGVCLPALVQQNHPSLLPGITRRQAAELQNRGMTTWQDVAAAGPEVWDEIGLPPLARVVLPDAIRRLTNGQPPLRTSLRGDLFDRAVPVALEFPRLAEQLRAGEDLVPSALHYERGGLVETIPLNGTPDPLSLAPLLDASRLITFGALDTVGLRQVLRAAGVYRRARVLDLLELLETHLHYPALGLDLETLLRCAGATAASPLSPSDRVPAVRRLIGWIA